VRCLGHRSR